MRTHPTGAEKRLWSMLRNGAIAGHRFRRQQIVFPYIVDFICLPARLIIEADGSQHADNRDHERRDRYLSQRGFRVLRFWNNQVLAQSDDVADAIFAALNDPHPPTAARRAQHEVNSTPCCSGYAGGITDLMLSPLQGEGLGDFHA